MLLKKFFSNREYVGRISNPFNNISPLLINYNNSGNNDQASSDQEQ